MKKFWILKGLKFLVFITLAVIAFTWIVMHLWNWVIPAVIGWSAITFWQALGLLVLSKILFGGFRGKGGHWGKHHGGGYWKHRMRERFEKMSPEEQERFRHKFRNRCGYQWEDKKSSNEEPERSQTAEVIEEKKEDQDS